MRRYIVKKSVVPIPPASGSVIDTLNVEDEITNAPSIRVVKELYGLASGNIPTSEVLWTNSNPSNSFGSQTITLKTNTYKYFRIFYRVFNSANMIQSIVIRPSDGFDICHTHCYTPSGIGYLSNMARTYCSSSQSKLTFSDCKKITTNSTTITTDNSCCIPVQVVGFN